MRNLVLVALLAAGCAKQAPEADRTAQAATLPTVTVDELAGQLATGCQAVDANNEATRKHMGVIPGAVLLTDYDDFKWSELPADKAKPLVFYCANTACDASHHAAEKALTAGYTNVKVLPAGIAGWVKAGKKVATI